MAAGLHKVFERLERSEVKVSCCVLRGAWGSNTSCLLEQFVLKHQTVYDFKAFLKQLLPWLHELETQNGSYLAKNVVTYLIDGVDAAQENLLIEEAKHYLSNELQGEIMTLAQRFEQRGREQGMQQGEKRGIQTGIELMAKKMLNQGLDKHMIADLSGLPLEEVDLLNQ